MQDDDRDYDDEPELAGYEPHGRPLRSPRLVRVMQVVVVVGLIGLILPGILITLTTANRTAQATCAAYTGFYAPTAVSFSARFELFSPSGMGWNCYAVAFGGDETLVRALGLIPGGPRLPSAPVENT
jgi:drug/metabolite transporter superfamily protein YnfA